MRLDAFISQNSDYTRKQIQQLVKQGQVLRNGSACNKSGEKILPSDLIVVEGIVISLRQPRYFMLHKPAGYVSATRDADHPTVLDLLDEPQRELLQVAGRLDIDTTGLLLITDDGQWNHAVTSPRRHCEKCYRVTTCDPITDAYIARFTEGVLLQGESHPTLPARLEIHSSHQADLWISEGRYHQVKRMFAAMGNRVAALHRSHIGALTLPNTLKPGEYRPLTASEIAAFN